MKLNSRVTRNGKSTMLAVTLPLCIFSLAIFFLTSYGLHIQRIVLKSNLFDDSTKPYEFVVDQLGNGKYNIQLKLLKKEGTDYLDVIENKVNFEIRAKLSNFKNNILQDKIIYKDSKIPYGYARDYIEMTLLSFDAKRNEKYKLEMSFLSSEGFFDLFLKNSNVLLIEEYYDSAAMPWLSFIKFISEVMLVASFLISMLLIYFILKKKKI